MNELPIKDLRKKGCTSLLHLQVLLELYKADLSSTQIGENIGLRPTTCANALALMRAGDDPLVKWVRISRGHYTMTETGKKLVGSLTAFFIRLACAKDEHRDPEQKLN